MPAVLRCVAATERFTEAILRHPEVSLRLAAIPPGLVVTPPGPHLRDQTLAVLPEYPVEEYQGRSVCPRGAAAGNHPVVSSTSHYGCSGETMTAPLLSFAEVGSNKESRHGFNACSALPRDASTSCAEGGFVADNQPGYRPADTASRRPDPRPGVAPEPEPAQAPAAARVDGPSEPRPHGGPAPAKPNSMRRTKQNAGRRDDVDRLSRQTALQLCGLVDRSRHRARRLAYVGLFAAVGGVILVVAGLWALAFFGGW